MRWLPLNAIELRLAQEMLVEHCMNPEDVPPQFQESKRPEPQQLFEELPAELPPEAAGEMPPEEPPPRAPEPFLRRG